MPTTKKVEYRGRLIGHVRVFVLEDWQNKERPAKEKDLQLINATAAADSLYEVLSRDPRRVADEEPDLPWVMVVLREVCTASAGRRDQMLEEHALLLYVQRFGMDQILGIWGADIGVLKGEIERMLALDNGPS